MNPALLCKKRERERESFFSVAAPGRLRADSKFAHQPVSFQCEVKIIQHFTVWPFDGGVPQQGSMCCGGRMECCLNQTSHFYGEMHAASTCCMKECSHYMCSKQVKQTTNPHPPLRPASSSCHDKKVRSCLLSDSVKVKVYLHTDPWEPIDLINSMCEEYYKMMRTS